MTAHQHSVVDIQSRVIPETIVENLRNGDGPDGIRTQSIDGAEWVVHRQGYRYPLLPAFYDLTARLEAMTTDGTAAAIVSIAPPMFLYWTDAGEAIDAAKLINDEIARLVASAPDWLADLATLPLQDPDASIVELRRAVNDLSLRGAEIGPHVEDVALDSSEIRPVLIAAQELHAPLEIHPYYVGPAPALLSDFYLTNLQGNPWQTAPSASRLILSGTLDALPDLDLLLVHGGGHLPYQIGRLDHGHRVRQEADAPRQSPSKYLRRFHYDSLTHGTEATRWLIDRVGADRVLYSTDAPFDMAGGSFNA
jgi:aminocarboxymuconate-semialdehyde decarboxylase